MADHGDGDARTQTFHIRMLGEGSQSPGRRSGRKSERPRLPATSPFFNRSKSDMISYEDLLVAQYLDELKRQKTEPQSREKHAAPSPYLQRLPHAHLRFKGFKHRPTSATVGYRPSSGKPKIDSKYIADSNLWDPATPRSAGKPRPASAPVRRLRPQSGVSIRSRPPSGRRAFYSQQPQLVRAFAYPNGTRDKFIHIAAPTMKILLECATDKLGLPFAARRVFLEDGTEVYTEQDIPQDAEIYISMGEKYKDPYQSTKRNMINRTKSIWTLMGIILPEKGRKKSVKPKLSKRMRALCDKKRVRILVFKNGACLEPAEVVTDLDDLDCFLCACTGRLGLGAPARTAFDVEGNKIKNLSDTPYLFDDDEEDVPQGRAPIRGPLWISSGTKPAWEGIEGFLQRKLQIFKESLKKSKKLKADVESALNNEENVSDPAVAKMTPDQLYEASTEVDEDIERWREKIKATKVQLKHVLKQKQEEEAAEFVEAASKKTEVEGIKIKVFENGQADGEFTYFFQIDRRFRADVQKPWMMEKLLDELSLTKFSSQSNRNLKAVAQKLYDKYGNEIKTVNALEPDQCVWLSFGEPFICPFTYCLSVSLDTATKIVTGDGEEKIVREVGPEPNAIVKDTSKWEGTIGFPPLYEMDETRMMEYDADKVNYLLKNSELDARSHYLLNKDKHDFVLYPEIGVTEKAHNSRDQLFVITKGGVIYNKAAPQMCLAVMDTKVEARMFDRDVSVEGFVVNMQKQMVGNPCQIWRFSEDDATISCQAYPNLLLTCLGNKIDDEDTYMNNRPEGAKVGERVSLVLADPLPRKEMSSQRFALKQERFDIIGQWKFTCAKNPEWNRQALSWPVKEDGTLNEKYNWPMEGFLMPYAPPLNKSSKSLGISGMTPVRLKVMKNGERTIGDAMTIVGPNLTNMLKENAKKEKAAKNKRSKGKLQEEVEEEDTDLDLHCMDLTVAELELQLFLEHCTGLLNLPFAARRLFDENGQEIFSLQGLERDQLVYVSCGEIWSDPRLTKVEQRRRFLLSQLASDVEKIQHYCSLRDPEEYVLEVGGPLAPNTPLTVNKSYSKDEVERAESSTAMRNSIQPESEETEQQNEQDSKALTAHERAHQRAEERHNTLKWPWERLVNVNNSLDNDDPEANKYSDQEMYQKFKPQASPRMARDSLQRFTFEDGYIVVQSNRALVLSVSETEGRVSDIVLAKKRPDDINQKWLIKENGEIRARYNQNLVFTVSMPTKVDSNNQMTFDRCPVTLQSRRTNQFGKAHQRWRYDADTGFIHAFFAELPDKEITAAHKADVCTYAISQGVDIDQPGYVVEMTTPQHGLTELPVCLSCARAMRGRYKVQKMTQSTNFHCTMGDAKQMKIRQVGSFKVLNNKVDLSTFEAEITLRYWLDTLESLRKQTSVQSISKEINAAKSVRTVKVLAYKNGEGRLRKGEIICGSSIEGILNQCTHRLGMSNAARRVYLEDGEIVLDTEDLVRHAVESCKNEMINMVLLQRAEGIEDMDNRLREEEEDEAVRLERLQRAASEEVTNQMRRSLDMLKDLEGEKSQSRGGHERGRGGEEEEEGEENDDDRNVEDTEQKDLDDAEALKIRREREKVLENMRLPPLDIILRAPIEVWVSSGKAFVSPDVVESKEENRRKKRQFRAQVCLALDIDKHVLRQMKGRRLDKMDPGVYKSTLSSKQPVVIEKHWQEPTVEEHEKHHSMHKLQTHLGEIRANQAGSGAEFTGINLEGKLYSQPNMKRIQVFPNGETAERSVYIWGSTLEELLESATCKLGLWKQAKFIYTLDGEKIEDFDAIQRDQLLCVSTGKSYTPPANQRVNIEVKANWGRARKRYGKRATDVVVDVEKNPKVDVDPFGPPQLALPVENNPAPPKPIDQAAQ